MKKKHYTVVREDGKAETVSYPAHYTQENIDSIAKARGYAYMFGPYTSLKKTKKWTRYFNSV